MNDLIHPLCEYSASFADYLITYIRHHWPQDQVVIFCAELLGVEVDNLRAWMNRRK